MRPKSVIITIWLSSVACALMVVLGIQVFVMPTLGSFVPAPAFPIPGKSFISAYRDNETDHYLFRFGIFGFGRRIRSADILIAGSSHPQLGLSAEEIAKSIAIPGKQKPVAFNIGEGYGEGLAFAREIVKNNNAYSSLVIVDLFSPHGGGISPYGRSVEKVSIVEAYRRAAETGTSFLRDWLTDRILPRASYTIAKGISFERALGVLFVRDLHTGDTTEIWEPRLGSRYDAYERKEVHSLLPASKRPEELALSLSDVEFFSKRGARLIATLVPYPEGDPARADEIARAANVPFVNIDASGLDYYDRDHLTREGKSLATQRFITAMKKSSERNGLFPVK